VAHYFDLGDNITIRHWIANLVKTSIKVTQVWFEKQGGDWNQLKEGELYN